MLHSILQASLCAKSNLAAFIEPCKGIQKCHHASYTLSELKGNFSIGILIIQRPNAMTEEMKLKWVLPSSKIFLTSMCKNDYHIGLTLHTSPDGRNFTQACLPVALKVRLSSGLYVGHKQ